MAAVNLRQLQYICEIAKRDDLSISAVAAALHANQPGISKQLKLLEEELGVAIFGRARNRLAGITPEGEQILVHAHAILNEVGSIRGIGKERMLDNAGPLVVAVTHTQARYVLPSVVKSFSRRYPKVRITMRHADPERIAHMLASGEADLGVTTNDAPDVADLVVLPLREFSRIVVVPRAHPLTRSKRLTLKQLAAHPLVTYEPAFTSREVVLQAFSKAGLEPNVVISAIDGDVIKTCVEQGLGYAVLSEVTFDPGRDTNLRALAAGHLFPPSVTRMWLSRQRYIRRYTYEFIEMCAPRWTRTSVQQLVQLTRRRRPA
ncbi:MAG: LysR substrate-binding domain-containing protein [Burkholderiales bacterium]